MADVDDEYATCIYNSSVLYQFTPSERELFISMIAEASTSRRIRHVSAENEEGIRLLIYDHGRLVEDKYLGDFDAHGRWLHWGN